MFSWFTSLFRSSKDKYDLYHPAERSIYHYWNGKERIDADPMVIYKRLMEISSDLSVDIKVAASTSKDNYKKHDCMIEGIAKVFQVESLGKGGLTNIETIDLLNHFLNFCDRVKKNSNLFPTSSISSVDFKTSIAEDQPTTNSSDSGSTEKESSTAEPPPSPLAQASL